MVLDSAAALPSEPLTASGVEIFERSALLPPLLRQHDRSQSLFKVMAPAALVMP